MHTPRKARYDAPAVRLAVGLIEYLAERGAAGLSEAARALGTNKNMAMRLFETLARTGWARRAADGGYELTLRPFRFIGRTLDRMDVVSAAEGPLRALHARIDEYVYLGVPHGDRVMFVRDLRPRHKPVQIGGGVGFSYPLHDNAPGKALLAWGEAGLIDRLARRGFPRTTPNTLTDPRRLRRHLAEVRRRGYATDLEENVTGVLCAAAPVFDRDGRAAGAVGTTVLTAYYTERDLHRVLGPAVVDAGRRISAALGYVGTCSRGREADRGGADGLAQRR